MALTRAHFAFPRVVELESRVPEWIRHLATDSGAADFQNKHGFELPKELQQYYKSIRLICLLQEAWEVDVFLEDMECDDPPEIRSWNGKPHVVIGYFAHSDTVCGAALTGDRCYMYWEGVFGNQSRVTLAEWVLGAAVRLLTPND